MGPGLALNPAALLNAPKDPADPAFQRAGSWLGRLELHYEQFTFSLIGAAKVLRQFAGLPERLLTHADFPSAEAAAGSATGHERRNQVPRIPVALQRPVRRP